MLSGMTPLLFAAALAPAAPFDGIDAAVNAAIARTDCPGAVVVVVHQDRVVFRKAYGRQAVQPQPETTMLTTAFDLASLTKPIATGTSVMKLIEAGRLRLDDPVAKHWPAFGANGKSDVTVAHLLLHTSGLTADNALADYAGGRATALERIAALKLEAPPGTRFRYSDVGFIVLGELVEKVGGLPVDQYAKRHVFDPLKMDHTGYRPARDDLTHIAPTGLRDKRWIRGEVHDPRAYKMGGVAGHAGLFGTADDLARYARMLLRGGELDGARVLSPDTVKLFTTPRDVPPAKAKDGTEVKQQRSYGWDVDTSYSSPRGDVFRKGDGFGHTGFTGTSLWVEPKSGAAVVILTNRVHPDETGNVTRLRREVADIVAREVRAK